MQTRTILTTQRIIILYSLQTPKIMKHTMKMSKAKMLGTLIVFIGGFGLYLKGNSSNSYASSTFLDSLRPPDTLFIDGGYIIRRIPRANQERIIRKTGDTLLMMRWNDNFLHYMNQYSVQNRNKFQK